MKWLSQVVASALLVGGGVFVGPAVASAATEDEIAAALLDSTAETLDIIVTDDALASILLEDLQYAIEEEVVDTELVADLSVAIDDGVEVNVDDALTENLEQQSAVWSDEAGELKAGLEVVKQEFYQCRATTDGPANECARGFGLRIQVALTETQLQQVEQLQARLGELSGDELAQAEAELLQAQERLTTRLQRVEEKITRAESRGENADPLKESLKKVQEKSRSEQPEESAPRQNAPTTEGSEGDTSDNTGKPNQTEESKKADKPDSPASDNRGRGKENQNSANEGKGR